MSEWLAYKNLYAYALVNNPADITDPYGLGFGSNESSCNPREAQEKCDCEKKGGKYESLADHDYKGSLSDCVNAYIGWQFSIPYGLGSVYFIGTKSGGALATLLPYVIALGHCNGKSCYNKDGTVTHYIEQQ